MREISIHNQYQNLLFDTQSVINLFHLLDTFDFCVLNSGELSIAFLDDPSLAEIHAQFLNDPSQTDVITFPGDPEMDLIGEICVSVDRAIAVSQELNTPFNEELSLYLIHGWLHLAGYNDLTDQERLEMRATETKTISAVKKSGTLPNFSLSSINKL